MMWLLLHPVCMYMQCLYIMIRLWLLVGVKTGGFHLSYPGRTGEGAYHKYMFYSLWKYSLIFLHDIFIEYVYENNKSNNETFYEYTIISF